MSILRYLQPRDGLPDPKGSLSNALRPSAIANANREVDKVIQNEKVKGKKRGQYAKYDGNLRCEIGRYTSLHGVAAASRYYSRSLGHKVSENTVYSMKKAYLAELKRKRSDEDDPEVHTLPHKKRGRPVLLGGSLDSRVQSYLLKVRESGGVITARIAEAAARGITKSYDESILAEYGRHVALNRDWAYSLLKGMKFVKRKVTTAKSRYSISDFCRLKKEFLAEVVTTVEREEIPPELILNWDQTGVKIVPSNTWTMEREGSKWVDVVAANDKRLITAIFCGSLVGDFLPVQVIYKGKTPRCHPKYEFPPKWHITHSEKHWSNEQTMMDYIEHIIIPYVDKTRENFEDYSPPPLVIMDNFKGQVTPAISHLLESHDIHVCLLPPNVTDRLQPMDLSVNKPAKDFLKRCFEDWYARQVASQLEGRDFESAIIEPVNSSLPIMKELGAVWLVRMAEYFADHPEIIVNGFIKSGISGALDGQEHLSEDEHSDAEESEDDFQVISDED